MSFIKFKLQFDKLRFWILYFQSKSPPVKSARPILMTRRQYSDPFGSDEEDEISPQDINILNSTEEKKPKINNSFFPQSLSVDSVST